MWDRRADTHHAKFSWPVCERSGNGARNILYSIMAAVVQGRVCRLGENGKDRQGVSLLGSYLLCDRAMALQPTHVVWRIYTYLYRNVIFLGINSVFYDLISLNLCWAVRFESNHPGCFKLWKCHRNTSADGTVNIVTNRTIARTRPSKHLPA
jgi:hypothetical protein